MKLRIRDLFCGAGGASAGLEQAGFDVYGVDHVFQPRYPHPERFFCEDAMALLRKPALLRNRFHAIWASPPCQRYSKQTVAHGRDHRLSHPDLIPEVRDLLNALGLPFVIENVPLSPLENPTMLCGAMFPPLRVYRHRLFEAHGFRLPQPPHPRHGTPGSPRGVRLLTSREVPHTPESFFCVTGHINNTPLAREAMQIPWMTGRELVQAIPPPYARYVGAHLLRTLRKT